MLKIKEFHSELNAFEVYNLFKNQKNSILLDSSKEDKNLSKYSFIGINEFMIFETMQSKSYIDGIEVKGDPFNSLEDLINKYKYKYNLNSDIPFLSGAIGYISYDAGRMLEELPDTSKEDFSIPDIRFIFYKNIIIFDLENNKKYITDIDGDDERVKELLNIIHNGNKLNDREVAEKSTNMFYSNFKKEEYKKAESKLKNYIETINK